jgi:hypothetical protein
MNPTVFLEKLQMNGSGSIGIFLLILGKIGKILPIPDRISINISQTILHYIYRSVGIVADTSIDRFRTNPLELGRRAPAEGSAPSPEA